MVVKAKGLHLWDSTFASFVLTIIPLVDSAYLLYSHMSLFWLKNEKVYICECDHFWFIYYYCVFAFYQFEAGILSNLLNYIYMREQSIDLISEIDFSSAKYYTWNQLLGSSITWQKIGFEIICQPTFFKWFSVKITSDVW